ncbi:carboxylesterase/lipase family protein [Rubellimicrobium arenae]|uniref:carboxylesterase/lipase family protein n=1 Tax=Rubellimicrobium arenae TaxID=2817372 RepID=UPI001B30E5CE|nr:carboxylesterase family protein [Rubellimicrobium arenae]
MNGTNAGALAALMTVLSVTDLSAQEATAPQDIAASTASPITTASGQVQGRIAEGVEDFFGIPYAAAPVGDLRWRPPAPVDAWEGVRPAVEYGAACPQTFGLDSARVEDEDCLFLNVQRPEGTAADARLPVLVFIHGGGWRTGSGNNENLNALVRENGIIGVTMNYRLGNLGNLAHPALTKEAGQSGNYGFMDQQAALRWVQENIAAFGGDPAQVTIAGESAGGGSVCVHMTAPSSEGLFARAIMMSTLCNSTPLSDAERIGTSIADGLNCTGDDAAACLRQTPVASLIDAPEVAWQIVSDTEFLPREPYQALQSGEFRKVPVLIGATRDEGRSFLTDWTTTSAREFDKEGYEQFVREMYGEDADAVLTVYPWPDDPTRYTGTYLAAEVMIENFLPAEGSLSPCKTNRITEILAPNVPTFAYEFAHSDASGWFEIPGYVWGAGHATELPYLIPERGNAALNANAFGEDERQLARQMRAYWGAFAKAGDPNSSGQPEWRAYSPGEGPILNLRGSAPVAVPAAALRALHNCDFWESLRD